jgi:hypothetical protein
VRGLEVTTIGQIHQSLFNPDLVREALAGDMAGEVGRASEFVSLPKVLDSGPPPKVAIVSPQHGSRAASDLLNVAARVADGGKGVGRIEWRVNNVTAAVVAVPDGAGPTYEVQRTLALDPGKNSIEVIAELAGRAVTQTRWQLSNGMVEEGQPIGCLIEFEGIPEAEAAAERARGGPTAPGGKRCGR